MAGMPLGGKMTLISKGQIRYEGTLVSMDRGTSTVTLSDVVSYGTEDRKQETFIPPSSDILEQVVFHTSDIDDLFPCLPPTALTADSIEYRPWTAEFDTLDGTKTKYNLPPFALPAADRSSTQASGSGLVRSPQTKALREQWAAAVPKGVDFERKSACVAPPTAVQSGQSRERLVQGYFESRHPQFGVSQL